jgi:hypothetical protein
LFAAQNQGEHADYNSYDYDSDENGTDGGRFFFGGGIYIRIEQAIHGGIVLLRRVWECKVRVGFVVGFADHLIGRPSDWQIAGSADHRLTR